MKQILCFRKIFSEGSSLTIQVKKLEWPHELVFCTSGQLNTFLPHHVMFKHDGNSISGEDTVAVDPVTSNDGEQRRAKNAEASVPKKVKEDGVNIRQNYCFR